MKKIFYILIMCGVLAISLPSCEQSVADDFPIMETFYVESVNLPTVSMDSIKSFRNKVDGYVNQFPGAKNHRRYSQIQKNIKAASIRINVTINYDWDGDTIIYF